MVDLPTVWIRLCTSRCADCGAPVDGDGITCDFCTIQRARTEDVKPITCKVCGSVPCRCGAKPWTPTD